MSASRSSTPRRPPRRPVGRPRNEQATSQIIQAASRLLGEVGYANLRMDDIAAEAQVSKSSLYRRWDSKSALVIAVIEDLFARRGVMGPETDDVWLDLESLVLRLVRSLRDTELGAAIVGIVFERSHNPEIQKVFDEIWRLRRERIVDILRLGVGRGQVRQDLDLNVLADLAAGTVYYRLLIRAGSLEDALAGEIVRVLRDGAATSPPQALRGGC